MSSVNYEYDSYSDNDWIVLDTIGWIYAPAGWFLYWFAFTMIV